MKWLIRKKQGRRTAETIPDFPAVAVRVYLEKRGAPRVVLQFNSELLQAAQWQPGDKLAVGVDERLDCIGLIRNGDGNAIAGGKFSEARTGKQDDTKRPYVSFNSGVYPEVLKWANPRKGKWVPVFIERYDDHQNCWVTRGRSIEDVSRVTLRSEKMDSRRRSE